MLYCIKFPLQQAAPDWPMWAPENTILSLLNCGAKLVAAGEAGQSWHLAGYSTPVQLESSALPAHAELPELLQDGESQDTLCHS